MARNPDWFLFNKILESYDKLKFPKEPCDRLVVHAGIREGERVLDVALRNRLGGTEKGVDNGTNSAHRDRHAGPGGDGAVLYRRPRLEGGR